MPRKLLLGLENSGVFRRFQVAVLVLLCIFLWTSQAVCPNLCSGHGICETYDLCNCMKGPDGEVAWTGYDCSLRICPK